MDQKFEAPNLPIDEMLTRLNASAVFGEPLRDGDTTVVPVAEVIYGFGAGTAYGKPGEEQAGVTDKEDAGEGGGSGGGAGGRAKPLGFIRLTADGAHYEPISDASIIPVAGILMVAWSVFWITAAIRAFAKR